MQEVYGRWTVVGEAPRRSGNRYVWAQCACGTERDVQFLALMHGKSKSCGCVPSQFIHGLSKTKAYRAWKHALSRCRDVPRYRDRGIVICERWRGSEGFLNFVTDMGEPLPGLTLDRINTNGNYEPDNCRWSTQKQQLRNTRRNVWIDYQGQRLCLEDACSIAGINRNTVNGRQRRKVITHQQAFESLLR